MFSWLEYNKSNLSGAIDVIVVRQADGSLKSTPFHVRFGKWTVLRSNEKIVSVAVNGKKVPLRMKLGNAGVAFFHLPSKDSKQNLAINDDKNENNTSSSKLSWGWGRRPQQSPHGAYTFGSSDDEFDDDASDWGTVELAEFNSGYSSDSTDLLPMKRWWGFGAIFGLFHKSEIEPVYLIKPISTDLFESMFNESDVVEDLSSTDTDDKIDKEFFSLVSPRQQRRIYTQPPVGEKYVEKQQEEEEERSDHESEKSRDSFLSDDTNDEDSDDDISFDLDIQLSLCKNELKDCDHVEKHEEVAVGKDSIFTKHLVTWKTFRKNPDLLYNENLVFKINGQIFPAAVALPMLVSRMAFSSSLDKGVISRLLLQEEKKRLQSSRGWRFWRREDKNKKTKTQPLELRPTADELEMLQLQQGKNLVTFSVTSELRGTQTVSAMIYLWDQDSRIVVSDIDGTITKSDLFGHILPFLGKDWSHSGVAQLYSNITKNQYKMMYLSSRPIGQAHYTRGYISTLRQDEVTLPEGPVITSPDGLFQSVNREMIKKNPEEFKITCLRDIATLFPGARPYYAGFGNRPSDVISYTAVGVPQGKIFTINKYGEIRTTNKTYKKSYIKLNDLVHEMFPAVNNQPHTEEEYNAFQYWKKRPSPLLDEDT